MWGAACHAADVRSASLGISRSARWGMAAAALAASCFARRARSQEADALALPVALEFQAEASCPDAAGFSARMNARAPLRLSVAPDALPMRVALRSSANGFRGELRTGSDDSGELREVTAATCDEVADALALIGALIVERTKREHLEQSEPLAPPAPSAPPAEALRVTSRKRPAVMLGVELLTTRPMASAPLTGGAVSLLVDGGLTWLLSAGYARDDVLTSPSRARTGYGVVTAGIGPPALRLAARVQLAGALSVEGGFVSAEGVNVDVPVSVRRSYWAIGALARLQWQIIDHGYLFVQGAGAAPLVERRFSTREPYERVATTAKVAPKLGVGVALGF